MRNPYNLEILSPNEYYIKGLELLKTNEFEGVKYLLTSGDNNFVRAYHALGMYYASKRNYKPALHYVFKAYDNGFYDLKELLFVYVYANAEGHKSHKRQMLEILSRLPSVSSLRDYSLLAYIGIALYIFDKKDEACEYLKKAIRKEEGEDAYYHLGMCYRHGFGVDKDIEHSYACFMLANDYPNRKAIDKELSKYKRKGIIKKKWKYKEKYAKRKRKENNV